MNPNLRIQISALLLGGLIITVPALCQSDGGADRGGKGLKAEYDALKTDNCKFRAELDEIRELLGKIRP